MAKSTKSTTETASTPKAPSAAKLAEALRYIARETKTEAGVAHILDN